MPTPHDRFRRVRTSAEDGTDVVSRLPERLDLLPDLEGEAARVGGDASAWDWLGPGHGFDGGEPGAFPGSATQARRRVRCSDAGDRS